MITSLYANFPHSVTTYNHGVWEVSECKEQARFKRLRLYCSNFHCIDPGLYSNWLTILKGAQIILSKEVPDGWFEDLNCDGIALCEQASSYHIVLVELKSTFSSKDIYKAVKQVVFSWLKVHMWLSLCSEYSPAKVKVTAIIACLPPKNPAGFLDKVRRDEMLGKLSEDLKLTKSLYNTRKKVLVLGDFIKKGVKLSEMLVDIPFNVHLQLADTVESETLSIVLDSLLGREV